MNTLFFLIDRIAIGLYIIAGAIALVHLRRWLLSLSEYRATYFELERDLARARQVASLTTIMLALLFVVAVLGIQYSVVPFLQTEVEMQGRLGEDLLDDGLFVTATPPPLAANAFDIEPVPPLGGDNEEILLLTPTLTPTPVGTIIPNAPPVEGCDDERAQLQVPANGMRVFQPITVVGRAFADEFSRAKIEISGPETNNQYGVIEEVRQVQRDMGAMIIFNPARYRQGEYDFRLVVFDLTDMPIASCKVTIYIAPLTTPTPTPTPAGGA